MFISGHEQHVISIPKKLGFAAKVRVICRSDVPATTLCPKKVIPLNILQQPPQTCTDLNKILHTQDDIYFCHRREIL